MAKQITVLKETYVEGVGLHTGARSVVFFKPAPAGYGIEFTRTDLQNKPKIRALCSNVTSGFVVRGTVIEKDHVRIHTIEHIMSACSALGIDNLIIEINNVEPPILDGSAKIIMETLLNAGLKELDSQKQYYVIKRPIHFESGKTKITAYPSDKFEIDCSIAFDHPLLKFQCASFENINRENYLNNIAPAKTFCFDYEIESLRSNGLALGGSLDNSIVLGLNGVHNKEPLRYENEFVRHKILDLIGDLYLAGNPIKAKIVAERPGHQNNIAFLKKFLKEAIVENGKKMESEVSTNYETSRVERFLSHKEVLEYIPHRHPFLMVDKIKIDTTDPTKAVGYKCVSGNETFFQGHFPGAPIMPGVLIVEAMAQTSCVMFLSKPEMRGKLAYFMSIDKTKFRRPVSPGDLLELRVEVLKDGGRRGKVKGKAYVDGKLTTEAEFVFIIVDREQQM